MPVVSCFEFTVLRGFQIFHEMNESRLNRTAKVKCARSGGSERNKTFGGLRVLGFFRIQGFRIFRENTYKHSILEFTCAI